MTLRLVSYNIRKGGRRRSRLISEVLRTLDPDLVVLQEAVDPWVVAEVAREIDARVLLSAPGRSVAVLSRMGELEGLWHRGARGPRYAEIRIPSIDGRLLGLHLTAGLSGRGERRRAREAEQVLATAEAGAGAGTAGVILVGDFNAVAPGDLPSVRRLPTWIRILLRVDGGISTRVMQRLLGAGFTDAFRRRNPDAQGATIPSDAPAVRLDYFLLGSAIAPRLLECRVAVADPVLLAAASDHLPIVLELATELAPAAEPEPEAVATPDGATEPEAHAAVARGDEAGEDATDQQRDGGTPGAPRNRGRRTMTA